MVAELRLGAPHLIRHTLKHLKAESILRRIVHLREQVGIRDGIQVVRSHTDVQVLRIFWLQTTLYDMQIVGVNLRLVRTHRVLPAT